ncbi:hypothetical protein NESM_000093700 [Novymonas esmeraldas]|uniref:Uncharacterized protein n=1 Tax=Novymonas esmeraldas TaxID=1808958 RepID=A0AAW0F4N9_9TRYP
MPIRRAAPTATEVVLAREACEPLLSSVTHRLLRGGFARYIEFRRSYAKECERAVASSTPASGSASLTGSRRPQPPPQTLRLGVTATATPKAPPPAPVVPAPRRRINPEGLKMVLAESGVLLAPEEHTAILLGYSDPVGFVLADELLAALHPCERAPPSLSQTVAAMTDSTFFAALPTSCIAVTMDSARDVLLALFAAELSAEEEQAAADPSSLAVAVADAEAGVRTTFTAAVYADAPGVPCDDVTTFIVLTLQQHPCLAAIMPGRFDSVSAALSLVPAPPTLSRAAASLAAASATRGIDGAALFSIRHMGSTTQRKFERYEADKDRRDEWIRGRPEADARSMYMRHAAGYAGHLPEFQYHFGRTFHVIEENLPQLTQPKPPLEPVPADWFGPGVELKDSRMNAHHYRFA